MPPTITATVTSVGSTCTYGGASSWLLGEFQATTPRGVGLGVIHTPLPERYSHADVTGFERLEKAVAMRFRCELAKVAVWVKQPALAVTP